MKELFFKQEDFKFQVAMFSTRIEHQPPAVNSRHHSEVHSDPQLSLSVVGKGAQQVASWLPKSCVRMLFPVGDRLVEYNNQYGASSKEELDRAACLKEKVLVGGNFC